MLRGELMAEVKVKGLKMEFVRQMGLITRKQQAISRREQEIKLIEQQIQELKNKYNLGDYYV